MEFSRVELLQLYLVINVTGLVETTEPGSVWEKNLDPSYLHLSLRVTCADYLRKTNILISISYLLFFVL